MLAAPAGSADSAQLQKAVGPCGSCTAGSCQVQVHLSEGMHTYGQQPAAPLATAHIAASAVATAAVTASAWVATSVTGRLMPMLSNRQF